MDAGRIAAGGGRGEGLEHGAWAAAVELSIGRRRCNDGGNIETATAGLATERHPQLVAVPRDAGLERDRFAVTDTIVERERALQAGEPLQHRQHRRDADSTS